MSVTTTTTGAALWLPATLTGAYTTERDRDIAWALAEFAARRADYALYADYLAGKHRRFWRMRDNQAEFTEFLKRVSVNFCPRLVAAFSDRLRIIGFEPHANAANAGKALAENAWSLWQDRRLERHFNQVFSDAVGLGDGYLLVWPDAKGKAQFYAESPQRMVIRYDAETRAPTLAAKLWQDDRRYRLNLYYANRIERYRTIADNASLPASPAGFALYDAAPDGGSTVANPYGRVPVFHFPFEGGVGTYGISALRPCLPIQDDYNVAAATLAVVREFQAWPLRWAIGVSPDEDLQVGPDRLLAVEAKDGKFGQFDAAPLEPYFANKEACLMELSAVTGVPPHILHRGISTPPSGEALKTAEAPLASRIEKAQTNLGDEAENAVAFGLLIERQANTVADGGHLTALWQSAYTRSDRDEAETVAIKRERIGLSFRRALIELGYSNEEVDDILKDKEAERRASAAAVDDFISNDEEEE